MDTNIVGYSDVTSASLEDRYWQGGFIMFVTKWIEWILYADYQKILTGWQSSLASQTLAFSEAADADALIAAHAARNIQAISVARSPLEKNVSLVETLKLSILWVNQHLRVDVAWMKEMIMKEIQTEWICGWEQVTDCLTNLGASSDILRD